jgi:hypothetical protein
MTRRSPPIACGPSQAIVFGVFLGALDLAGCVDPKGDYQDFSARPLAEREASIVDVQRTPCQQLIEQDPSGQYFMSCRPMALPTPFGLAITQTLTGSGDAEAAKLVFSFTPLAFGATNLSATAGDTMTLAATPLSSDCTYTEDIGTLTLGRTATVLDRELTATNVVLRAKLLSQDRACGELDGSVDLIMLDLTKDGDICVMVRAPDDGTVPPVSEGDYSCDSSLLPPRGTL